MTLNPQDELLERARKVIRELREKLSDAEARSRPEPIAVIGMGIRLPGCGSDQTRFWQMILEGRDAVSSVPADRWDCDAFHAGEAQSQPPAGKVNTRAGAFLEDVRRFDAAFFDITPREAMRMDPQQRIFLETAWHALEDAGLPKARIAGTDTGVFVGVHNHSADYRGLQFADPATLDAYSLTGTAHDVIGGRLAYWLDLHGPAITVNTACSSSLTAVHLALRSLRAGDCTMAIVGGVNLLLTPPTTVAAAQLQLLSADGRCKAFDARADGMGRGEGCGVVVLKKLDAAVRDGDRVLAMLRGSAVNQDGRTNGMTAPNGLAQQRLLRSALKDAGVEPGEIGYVEAHGTGTKLGDPIEVEALAAVLGGARREQPCTLGAVKANVGHLEGAAGIAGLIKTVLVLRHRWLPPVAHLETLNPHLELGAGLRIPQHGCAWKTASRRLAGVSSFGWSGSNVHVVLEEAASPVTAETMPGDWPILVSAQSPEALRMLALAYADRLELANGAELANISYTTAVRRTHHAHRIAVMGSEGKAIAAQLRARAAHPPVEMKPGQISQSSGKQMLAWEAGTEVDWSTTFPAHSRVVDLPPYPFQGKPYWLNESAASLPAAAAIPQDWLYSTEWKEKPLVLSGAASSLPAMTWLLFHAEEDAGGKLAGAFRQRGHRVIEVVREVFREVGREVRREVDRGGRFARPSEDKFVLGDDFSEGIKRVFAELTRERVRPQRAAYLGGSEDATVLTAEALELAKAVALSGPSLLLWFITQPALPGHAALRGFSRVFGLEHPELAGGVIDLDSFCEENLGGVCAELAQESSEDRVSLRHGSRWVMRLRRDRLTPEPERLQLRADRCYLVTGAYGHLGRKIASWLVDCGARHLALIGRRNPAELGDAEWIRQLDAWRELGITVLAEACDVAQEPQVHGLLAKIDSTGRALAGVVHAAAGFRFSPIMEASQQDVELAFRAKVEGARVLDHCTRACELDFFVLFGSAAATVGLRNGALYAAANSSLEAIRAQRQAEGLPVLLVEWGLWEGAYAEKQQELIGRSGFRAMQHGRALPALGALINAGRTTGTVADIEWAVLGPALEVRGRQALVEGLIAESASATKTSDLPQDTAWLDDLRALPPPERGYRLLDFVADAVRQVFGMTAKDPLEEDRGLFQMGMDSLMSVRLKRRLEAGTGLRLPGTLTLNYPTISALARYLDEKLFPAETPTNRVPAIPVKEKIEFPSLDQTLDQTLDQSIDPIAIVGMACRFPGGADSPEGYWELLLQGRDAVGKIPRERMDLDSVFDPRPQIPGKTYSRWAGLLEKAGDFDAEFFGISPREAVSMDPQQRLLLEVSWEALEHAGIHPRSLAGQQAGVFVGITTSEYAQLQQKNISPRQLTAYVLQGSALNATAGRLSYFYGLNGPSMAIDTACSSSLVAIDRACRSLREGESQLAMAAGVNVLATAESLIIASQWGMLSPSGKIRAFSSAADGFVRGEGCGVVVLKRLRDAERSGDRILGVILGSAVNQDGASSGLTVPNGLAQQALLREAHRRAGIEAWQVGYVEAHGTGTELGDPIEAEALGAVFGAQPREKKLLLGSVKTNVGHLESAAGVAGLIKVVLGLEHGVVPAQLHGEQPSEHVRWSELPLEVVTESRQWPAIAGRRIAGVSAFGFSGTNAHVVVESWEQAGQITDRAPREEVLVVTARTEAALRALVKRYVEFLSQSESDWSEICYTAAVGRAVFAERLAVMANTKPAAAEKLQQWLEGVGGEGVYAGQLRAGKSVADTAPELAAEFVRGAAVDWAGYWSGRKLRRVALPTYAFQRERYWIEARAAQPAESGEATGRSFLGRRLRTAGVRGQYETQLTAASWIGEHVVEGRAVLPATGHVELMLEAGAEIAAAGWVLEDVVLESRLEIAGERRVQTVLEQESEGRSRVRVYAEQADAQWERVSEGWLVGTDAATQPPETLPLERLRERLEQRSGGEEFYAQLASRGLEFGECFRGVAQVWVGEGEALGEIVSRREEEESGWELRPWWLDACLQVAGVAAGEDDEEALYLPLSLERLEMYGHPGARGTKLGAPYLARFSRDVGGDRGSPLYQVEGSQSERGAIPHLAKDKRDVGHPSSLSKETCRSVTHYTSWSHVTIRRLDAGTLAAEVTITTPAGAPLVRIHNLRFRKLKKKTAPSWLYRLHWRPEVLPGKLARLDRILVVGNGELAANITLHLLERGTIVDSANDSNLTRTLSADFDAVLWVADQPEPIHGPASSAAETPVRSLLTTVQQLLRKPAQARPRLYVVTTMAHAVTSPDRAMQLAGSLLAGLGTGVAMEAPELGCTRLDCDLDDYKRNATQIVAEVQSHADSQWVAFRSGNRYAAKLERLQPAPVERMPARVQLQIGAGIEALTWAPDSQRALQPEEVEIGVEATSLNFRDVMLAVGAIGSATPIGTDCAGTVLRTGKAVTDLAPGDPVIAIAPGSFASHVVARRELVVRKPERLSFAQAAAQSIAYLTADYCLNTVARVRQGERVLIHAGAGGVGLAAIHLCRKAGAEPIATAGSEEKRSFLKEMGVARVYDSRSLAFATEISGGVDIVLNSLAGEAIDAGLRLLNPGGRFIELGKTDVRASELVERQWPGVRYLPVDLTPHFAAASSWVSQRLAELFQEIGEGSLPLLPVTVFDSSRVKEAFRFMARAEHKGRVVVAQKSSDRFGGTHLITGGLRGIGLKLAEWLAANGAGGLVLVGRRAPDEAAHCVIERLRAHGVAVRTLQGDIADLKNASKAIEISGPDLRGVWHGAGLLDNAPLEEQSWDRMLRVFRPKIDGAWNLHVLTRELPIERFVLFSSWASIGGSYGQVNHCAASSFLDGLAHFRRAHGLPALTVDWGAWGEAGAAADDEVRRNLERSGMEAMPTEAALEALRLALRSGESQVAIASIHWARYLAQRRTEADRCFYTDLLSEADVYAQPAAKVPGKSGFAPAVPALEAIDSLPATMREAALLRTIAELVRRTLDLHSGEEIDPDMPLGDLGMDSLLAIELRNGLSRVFHRQFQSTILFDYPTLRTLARYVDKEVLHEAAPQAVPVAPMVAASRANEHSLDILQTIEQMSDEEVESWFK